MTFLMGFFGFGLSALALQEYSFTNLCFPAKVMVVNAVFLAVLLYRRKVLSESCAAAA